MNSRSRASAPSCMPCRFAAIGAAVVALAGTFAYAAGWLTPSRLTTYRIIDQFQANSGSHPGYRRNHAKGLCVEGYFDSNGNAAWISRAQVFAAGRTPVIGRFAIPGGNPSAPDASVPVRSFALLFRQHDGEQWRTAMNSTPVFAVRTPEQFYQQLVAARPDPKTGKPDPAKLKAFYAANPDTRPFQEWVKTHPASSGLANSPYFSINAFRFVDAGGHERAVRWSVEPEMPYAPVDPQEKSDPDFLSDQLGQQLQHGNVRWHLIVTVANTGDPTNDATLQWPADRQRIDAGTVVLERTSPQSDGACRDVNFDPTVLPDGIKTSDDPLLAARSAAYAVSYQRRTREEALHGAAATQQP
ncbi:Catalase-related peroxidase [Paraburkholderia sabiae]|uniref:catalase family peroxidase n=1 Tax=Paraburkholderia sabiae TaxID=273251 RepID=UPI001CAD6593|nr:catalase family peroxidase [Paraburkholderia sabiae]CAG9210246.1 Catalase-related peroxidase [Paraburkholderia sabiae]